MSNLSIKKPTYRIFRSERGHRLFALHATDSKENSIGVIKDSMTFEEAQECMLEYEEITNVVQIEEVKKIETEVASS